MQLDMSVNKVCCSHQALTPTPMMYPDVLRMRKHRMLAPESWGTHQGNDFREPRFLHLPTHREVLNAWLHKSGSFILTVTFWCCSYLVFVVKTRIDHSPSLTSSVHTHRAIWEAVSLGLWSQNVCWITHNSQVLDYVFFSFHKGITHILHGWVSKAPSLLEDLDKGKARVEMKQKGMGQGATFKRMTHSHRAWQKLVRAN